MTSHERMDRRHFLKATAISAAGLAFATSAEAKRKNDKLYEGYDIGGGSADLAKSLLDELSALLKKVDRNIHLDQLPNNVRDRIYRYLEDYGGSLMLSSEQRTLAVDAEALMYVTKDARSRPALDRRIVEVLEALFESTVRKLARESTSLLPPPEPKEIETGPKL